MRAGQGLDPEDLQGGRRGRLLHHFQCTGHAIEGFVLLAEPLERFTDGQPARGKVAAEVKIGEIGLAQCLLNRGSFSIVLQRFCGTVLHEHCA